MEVLKVVLPPSAIIALFIVRPFYNWPLEIVVIAAAVLFLIGVVLTISYFSRKNLERSALQLKELAAYFTSRFAGNSSLSVFALIDSLAEVERPDLRGWVWDSSMSRRVMSAWCESFNARVEADSKLKTLGFRRRAYLRELWSQVTHYQEFIEQFYEVAQKAELPAATRDQYNRFVVEYNAFVQKFQDYIGGLRKRNKTEIEPPSVKLTRELATKPAPQRAPRNETRLPEPPDNRGYILGRRPSPSNERD